MEAPTRNLALDLVRVTEAAALSSARWLGRGDPNAAESAAIEAMRKTFDAMDIKGRVAIGEADVKGLGEFTLGTKMGTGNGPAMDVAVDPLEGTKLVAYGRPNAISVACLAPAGSLLNPGTSVYMKKLVVPSEAARAADIEAPVNDNLKKIAKALGKDVDDLTVFVLDKPRHARLIQQIRAAGARILLATDGDITGSLMVLDPHTEVDLMMGTGGTAEGVITAIAATIMGGAIQAAFDPQGGDEKTDLINAGIDTRHILTTQSMVKTDDLFMAITGVSGGSFMRGVTFTGTGAVTYSISMRGLTGSVRYMESRLNWDKLMRVSAVKYD